MKDNTSTPTTEAGDAPDDGGATIADEFKATVTQRFGVLPNFFCSAPAAAGLIEELWAFAKSAYLDSPLPSLFKERLFVHLSRFCEVRYCIVRHVGFLVGEGRPAGDADATAESVQQALTLLTRPVPDADALTQIYARLQEGPRHEAMPGPGTQAEHDLFDALTVIFVAPNRSAQARAAVRHAVGDRLFELLTAFLAFVRTAHYWTETHPELAYEPDVVALMDEHPDLAAVLLDTAEAEAAAADSNLRRALDANKSALRESEDRYRAFVTASSDVVYKMSPDWTEMRELGGQGFLADTNSPSAGWREAYILPDDRAMVDAAIDSAVREKRMFKLEHRVRRADGTIGWTSSRAVPMFDAQGSITEWIGAAKDVSEQKCAEVALRESEERRDLALEATQLGTFVWHVREDRGEPDARMLALFDQPSDGRMSLRTALATMIHPDDGERYAAAVAEASRPEGSRKLQTDIRVRRKDGSWRWLEIMARVSFDSDGQPTRMAGTALDITDRKVAEISQQEAEEQQAFLLNLSDELRPLADPIEIMATASALTGPHLGLDRCFYGEVDATLEHVYFADSYCAQGVPPFPQRVRLEDFSEEITAIMTAGATFAVDDIRNEQRLIGPAQSDRFLAAQIEAFVGVPLVKGGRLVAILSAHQSSPRQWTPNEIALLEEVGERTWAAVERARAEEALRDSERHANILLAELQHRVRNTLGVVRSIARRTADNSGSPDEMLAHFQGRLDAFSRVQAALTRSPDAVVDLASLIEDEMVAHAAREGEQVSIDGPEVPLNPKTAERLSLAIHELTTNAVKHGAFVTPEGRVRIRWSMDVLPSGDVLTLDWTESGVTIDPLEIRQNGFGMELLQRSLPYDLQAETSVQFRPHELHFTLRVPLPSRRSDG